MSKQSETQNPKDLITVFGIQSALNSLCKDEEVSLRSWEIIDFAGKGDNYGSVVSSVKVAYLKDEKEFKTSFVVKMNPCGGVMKLNNMAHGLFMKECQFYTNIVPELNKILETGTRERLKVPECYHTELEKDKETIYLEDLREAGFKMPDRKKTLDKAHLNLICMELGRLHAASVFLKGNNSKDFLLSQYPCLKELFLTKETLDQPFMHDMSTSMTNAAAEMINHLDEYKVVADKMRTCNVIRDSIPQLDSTPPFEVICHGDCWTNNLMFKYDEKGIPQDIRLLDAQVVRIGSPALDLNYLFFTSIDGPTRRRVLNHLLETYYSSFQEVFKEKSLEPPFSLPDLKLEFKNKNRFGLMMAMMTAPFHLANKEDTPDYLGATEDASNVFESKSKKDKKTTNGVTLRDRFLDTIDYMLENNVI